jgi:hypothetical protein
MSEAEIHAEVRAQVGGATGGGGFIGGGGVTVQLLCGFRM